MQKIYSLRKSRQILHSGEKAYQKKKGALSSEQRQYFEQQLKQLEEGISQKREKEASDLAHQVEAFHKAHLKKSFGASLLEMVVAIIIALVVATVVRQMWFELYEIPTGSMRPTFKEQDHLTVTKTAFGINVPLATRHFYFDPSLVQRTGVVIWSGDGVPNLDSDSTFMGIFPYTKRFIKRCLGKPGDTLYFYGGKIYGFDSEGNDLVELRNNPWMVHLENLPFTNFEGRLSYEKARSTKQIEHVVFNHFNQAIGRLNFSNYKVQGEVFNGIKWVKDRPDAQRSPHETIQTYSDWWGIRNFAVARLLSPEQLERLTPYRASEMEKGLLYLELRHTPSLSYPSPLFGDHFRALLKGYSTVIPLQEKHLKALMENMYTCRFIVKNGRATPYRLGQEKISSTSPSFPGISDGTYEFYYGKAKQIGWGGVAYELPADHPLYSDRPPRIQKLFNVGIEMNTQVEPRIPDQPFFPNRYVYFREGALYAMGGILMEKEDPLLVSFNKREQEREKGSSQEVPYVAFKDYGPPLTKENKLDKEFIKTFGLKIPTHHYLVLGDNHAMSQDSRYFGPIPQENLQGAPSLIIWPPGERWGIPNQRPYPLFTIPRLIVWSLVALIALVFFFVQRRKQT